MATRGVSMTVQYRAWDTSANAPKTGDVANHTLRWIKDGTAGAPTNSPSEVDATNAPGVYKLTLTATEADADIGDLAGKSSTANVVLIGPQIQFERLPNAAPGANGGLATVNASNLIAGIQGTVTDFDELVAQAPSEADIADAVCDEALAGHTTAGTVGKTLSDVLDDVTGLNGDAMRGTDSAALASVCTEARLAELDAANLPADVAAVNTTLGAAGAGLTAIPWNAAWDAEVESEVADALTAADVLVGADVGSIADAVCDEALAGHTTPGTLGQTLTDVLADVTGLNGDAMRGTDGAALATVCTEARLAELDAANLPADVDGLLAICTEARLAELDAANMPADLDSLLAVCTEARLAELDAANLPADLDALIATVGVAGAGLTAVPWNAAWDAEVESEAADALAAVNLDHLVGDATDIPAVPAGTYLDQVMDDGTATYDRATDSLQAIRDRGDDAWSGGGEGVVSVEVPTHVFVIPKPGDNSNTARETRRKQVGEKLWCAVDFSSRVKEGNRLLSVYEIDEPLAGLIEDGTEVVAADRVLLWLDADVGEAGQLHRITITVVDSLNQKHSGDILVELTDN